MNQNEAWARFLRTLAAAAANQLAADYLAMRALEKRGLVELVPNRHPQHWRLVAQYRVASPTSS
jgi:hypothetical protein